jgi:N-succinyldiaminopimelate aminotransferase
MGDSPYLVERMQGFGTTIFAEMSALAVATGSINLGQGFPDEDGPPEVLEAAIAAVRDGHNQYPPGVGIPELRHAITAHQGTWYDLDYDADTEVLVTAGATEAIAAALLALCEPGSDVVTFEPYYDSYAACIAMASARRLISSACFNVATFRRMFRSSRTIFCSLRRRRRTRST